jgi:hypothetical protein
MASSTHSTPGKAAYCVLSDKALTYKQPLHRATTCCKFKARRALQPWTELQSECFATADMSASPDSPLTVSVN